MAGGRKALARAMVGWDGVSERGEAWREQRRGEFVVWLGRVCLPVTDCACWCSERRAGGDRGGEKPIYRPSETVGWTRMAVAEMNTGCWVHDHI